jgi:hypothetical protein
MTYLKGPGLDPSRPLLVLKKFYVIIKIRLNWLATVQLWNKEFNSFQEVVNIYIFSCLHS